MSRRLWAVAGAGIVLLLAAPRPAHAHALLAASDPADGARLDEAPPEVMLHFTEPPELTLSSVTLLDRTGAQLEAGDPEPVPGDPAALRVPLPQLEQGVYTVTWRVVSKVDGHPTGGTFAFGVGVSPIQEPPAAVEEPHLVPEASPLEMAGRLVLFVGLGLLVGTSWVGGVAFAEPPGAVRKIAVWAWAVGVVGIVVLAIAQHRAADVGFGDFLPTTIGRALIYRCGAMVLAGTGLLAASLWARSSRGALLWAGAAAAGVMLIHTAAGHAAQGNLAWAKVGAQWVHFAAVGVWLGGLAALLVGVRGRPDETKASAVRRFSAVAAFALAALAVTGVVRSVNEVGSWGALFSTGYGQLVLVKAGLIVGLAGLGAVNRYRNVPRVGGSLRELRRISRGELVLAVGALSAAAALATLVPPAQVPPVHHAPAAVTARASDFAKSVRVRLGVDPGLPGANRFVLGVTDYDSGDPVSAERVSLRFSYVGAAQVEDSTLELEPTADEGDYQATGSNLSIGGPWEVAVLVQQGADSVEVPLELATLCTAVEIPGEGAQPTIHTVEVPEVGSVEGYLIPLGGGETEVHFTFLNAAGREVRVEGTPSITAWHPGMDPIVLQPEALSRGHFLALATLEPGHWRFDGSATGGGTSLAGCFEQELPQ